MITMHTETQKIKILEHLLSGKTITTLQAIRDFGCTRLSGRIYDLKKMGYNILSKMIEVDTRNGNKTRVSQYWLDNKQAA